MNVCHVQRHLLEYYERSNILSVKINNKGFDATKIAQSALGLHALLLMFINRILL